MTVTEILNNLKQRIADGDTTVTAAELQQAEASVEFARIQSEGQQQRDEAAAHQALLDELETIRGEVENGLPNTFDKIRTKLLKIDKDIAEVMGMADEHDRTVTRYGARIQTLAKQGAVIDDLEYTADGIYAGDRRVSVIGLNNIIVYAARKKADFPSSTLTLAERYRPVDTPKSDSNVTVQLLRALGGNDEGDTVRVLPSIAEQLIQAGDAEAE